MSTERFPAEWLDLREPVDHRSRSKTITGRLAEAWRSAAWTRVLDLGSGSGSNLRYLAPRLSGPQDWTLLDHDAGLLARCDASGGVRSVQRVVADLDPAGIDAAEEADLVTASALLDLVSTQWLEGLVDACVRGEGAAHFALIYDGAISWGRGAEDLDEIVRDAVNAHQRTDKGLGPALGPTAATRVEELFRAAGFRCWLEPSPWRLGSADADLAGGLLDGWVSAAIEQRPADAEQIRTWGQRRGAHVVAGDFDLTVGHVDVLALPPDLAD